MGRSVSYSLPIAWRKEEGWISRGWTGCSPHPHTKKKYDEVVTQSIGRIARKYEERKVTYSVAYDYVDAIGFCENQWKKRKTSYRKAGCEIDEDQKYIQCNWHHENGILTICDAGGLRGS